MLEHRVASVNFSQEKFFSQENGGSLDHQQPRGAASRKSGAGMVMCRCVCVCVCVCVSIFVCVYVCVVCECV